MSVSTTDPTRLARSRLEGYESVTHPRRMTAIPQRPGCAMPAYARGFRVSRPSIPTLTRIYRYGITQTSEFARMIVLPGGPRPGSWHTEGMGSSESGQARRILALDIGSSSARSEVFTQELEPIPETFHQETYALQTGLDGRAELSPDSLVDTVARCLDRSLTGIDRIDLAGTSCFWHSIMGVDRHGDPTSQVLTWADTRASIALDRLTREVDPEQHHQETGTRLHSSYPMAKLRWLNEHCHDIAARTERWMSFPEYLQERLAGSLTVSTSMASGTGLLNRHELCWDREAIRACGIDDRSLSPIDDRPLSGLGDERWPALSSARWYPAIGDGAANNLGSGAVDARHPALMVGTTGALRLVTPNPPETLPERLWQYRLDQNHALLGGALSEGGGVIVWLADNLRTPEGDALEKQIQSAAPDSHGLTVLPYLAGERSPGWHSDALGTIHGLRFETSALDILQATMESIGYSFASILEDLTPMLQEPVEIIATGNGLRLNQSWVQMIADILGYPLLLPRQTESSLRGAAMHALQQEGLPLPDFDLAGDSQRFDPRPDRHEAYASARQRQEELYRLLIAGSG